MILSKVYKGISEIAKAYLGSKAIVLEQQALLLGATTSEDGNYVYINTNKNIVVPAIGSIEVKEDGTLCSILVIEIYNEKSIRIQLSSSLQAGTDISLNLLDGIDAIGDGKVFPIENYPVDNIVQQIAIAPHLLSAYLDDTREFIVLNFDTIVLFDYSGLNGLVLIGSESGLMYIISIEALSDISWQAYIDTAPLFTDIITLDYTPGQDIVITTEAGVELEAISGFSVENQIWETLGISPIELDNVTISVIDSPIAEYYITPPDKNPFVEIVLSTTGSPILGRGVQVVGDGNLFDLDGSNFVNSAGDIFSCSIDTSNPENTKLTIEIIPYSEESLENLDSTYLYIAVTHIEEQVLGLITLQI